MQAGEGDLESSEFGQGKGGVGCYCPGPGCCGDDSKTQRILQTANDHGYMDYLV